MKYLGWLALILLFGLTCTTAIAEQINIPPESPRDTIIEATVTTDMPPEAEFFGDWEAPGVSSIPVGRDKLHIAGKSGAYLVTYGGYWILMGQEITVKDINGVPQTFRPLLDHGKVKAKQPYKITEGDQPDPPDPTPDPPNPAGPKQIVFFIVSDDLDKPGVITPAQRELVTSLQVRQDLLDLGHQLIQVIDNDQIKEGVPSKWAPWIRQAMNKPLPLMAYADKDGGEITVVPMPDGWIPMLNVIGGGE